MRVIAGSARGRHLQAPTGLRVRPTSDRVKEALFSSLASRFGSLDGLIVLDVFCGTGNLGIEALSRGAASAVFIDSHAESVALTSNNLRTTRLAHAATVIQSDAVKGIRMLHARNMTFDIILADPPYADSGVTEALVELIEGLHLLTENGVFVIETDSRYTMTGSNDLHLEGRKIYGDTAVWTFGRADQCL